MGMVVGFPFMSGMVMAVEGGGGRRMGVSMPLLAGLVAMLVVVHEAVGMEVLMLVAMAVFHVAMPVAVVMFVAVYMAVLVAVWMFACGHGVPPLLLPGTPF